MLLIYMVVDNSKCIFFKIVIFERRINISSSEKLNMIRYFSIFSRSGVSGIASLVYLQIKDSILAFIYTITKLRLKLTDYAIDRLVVSSGKTHCS